MNATKTKPDINRQFALQIIKSNPHLSAIFNELLVALCKMVCPECGHELQHHADKYGCDIERGDREGDEYGPAVALPPCGCDIDELRENGWFDFARALETIKKTRGEL